MSYLLVLPLEPLRLRPERPLPLPLHPPLHLLGRLRPRGLQRRLGLPRPAQQPRLELALLPPQLGLVAGLALL